MITFVGGVTAKTPGKATRLHQRVDAGETGRPIPERASGLDHEYMSTDTRADVLVFGEEALGGVQGELDLFSLDVLREPLADVPAVSRVVIDLQGVEFL